MFCLITACLTAARRCSSCAPIRLPPLSEFSGKLTAHLKRRTGQNPKAVDLSGIPQGQEKPWPALRPHVWLRNWTLLIKSSSWSTGKTSITRPWRSISASLRTVSMVRIIQQASEETWIRTITKSSSQPFRNSITWWKPKLTCPSINSRWCLSLMSVTAASLVRPRKTSKRNSDAFISLVLPVHLFSRKMHWGQKPPPASSGVNYILTSLLMRFVMKKCWSLRWTITMSAHSLSLLKRKLMRKNSARLKTTRPFCTHYVSRK